MSTTYIRPMGLPSAFSASAVTRPASFQAQNLQPSDTFYTSADQIHFGATRRGRRGVAAFALAALAVAGFEAHAYLGHHKPSPPFYITNIPNSPHSTDSGSPSSSTPPSSATSPTASSLPTISPSSTSSSQSPTPPDSASASPSSTNCQTPQDFQYLGEQGYGIEAYGCEQSNNTMLIRLINPRNQKFDFNLAAGNARDRLLCNAIKAPSVQDFAAHAATSLLESTGSDATVQAWIVHQGDEFNIPVPEGFRLIPPTDFTPPTYFTGPSGLHYALVFVVSGSGIFS